MTRILILMMIIALNFSAYDLSLAGDEKIKKAQIGLTWLGYNPGRPDGISGPRTKKATKEFQIHQGLAVTEKIDDKTFVVISEISQSYLKCLSDVLNKLQNMVNGEVLGGFSTKTHNFEGLITARGYRLVWTEGTPEDILTTMQSVIEGSSPRAPLVSRCKQSAINYRKK